MMTQWIANERYHRWQIYHSPPGYANINSNIESFNRQIKGFTQKKKLSIFGILDKCSEIDKSLFKKVTNIKFNYKRWIINKTEQTCSCRSFLKHAICPHSLVLAHIKDWNWFGPECQTRSNEFVYKNKKGAKKGSRYKSLNRP